MEFLDQAIENYAIEKSHPPSDVCERIFLHTVEKVPGSQMLIGKLEASFLRTLLLTIQAKKVLEIGTFTGYSALAMAEVLPEDGRLVTLDINVETGDLAKQFWKQSPHGEKIELIYGPAIETLESLKGPFDLIFIDADKNNYLNYLKKSLDLISERGLIVIDNVLWSGRVLEKVAEEETTESIQRLNDYIQSSKDFHATLVPIRDGIFIVKKI